jgi:hypothetical protein
MSAARRVPVEALVLAVVGPVPVLALAQVVVRPAHRVPLPRLAR